MSLYEESKKLFPTPPLESTENARILRFARDWYGPCCTYKVVVTGITGLDRFVQARENKFHYIHGKYNRCCNPRDLGNFVLRMPSALII